MSTILDALRKAQEETGGRRESSVGDLPPAGGGPAPRRDRTRRAFGWLAAILGVLAIAFVGGLALGNRVGDLFGKSDDAPSADVAREPAADAEPERVAAAPKTLPAEAPTARVSEAGVPPDAPQVGIPPRTAHVPAAPRAADGGPDPGPTPYGRLHVFGADGSSSKPYTNEDRLARLQQLRERMLKARREAAQRGADPSKEPTQIIVPPPQPPTNAVASAPRPIAKPDPALIARHTEPTDGEIRDPDISPLPGETLDDARPVARVAAAPAPKPAPPAEPAPAPAERVVAAVEPVAPAAEPVAPSADVQPAPAPVVVAAQSEEPAEEGEESAAVAAEAPAQVAAIAPAAPAPTPPVLRRSPGGAPQVSINILQWSSEPERRFAFVSVDGGGMTQVREGDRIGGLTVKHIHQQMIEFGFNDSSFLLRAN